MEEYEKILLVLEGNKNIEEAPSPSTSFIWSCIISLAFMITSLNLFQILYVIMQSPEDFDSAVFLSILSPFLFAVIGSSICGSLIDAIGRKNSIYLGCINCLIGLIVSASSANSFVFVIGRLILGIGIGWLVLSANVLIFELSPKKHKRKMFQITQAMWVVGVALGILLVAPFTLFSWRTVYLTNILILLLYMIAMYKIPDSPSWQIDKEYFKDGLETLQRKYGQDNPVPIAREFRYHLEVKEKQVNRDDFSNLGQSINRFSLSLAILLQFLQAASGYTFLSIFTPVIFDQKGLSVHRINLYSCFMIIPEVCSVFLYIKYCKKSSRNIWLGISSFVSFLCCIVLGFNSSFPFENDIYLLFLSLTIFKAAYSSGFGSILNEMAVDLIPDSAPCSFFKISVPTFWICQFIFLIFYGIASTTKISAIIYWILSSLVAVTSGLSFFWQREIPDIKRHQLQRDEDTESEDFGV